MASICSACGRKISVFSGNQQDTYTISQAKQHNVYDEGLCIDCQREKIAQATTGDAPNEFAALKRKAVLNKIFVSTEPKPTDLKDLGMVTGYCILGTGPVSSITSSFADFFGSESAAYLKIYMRITTVFQSHLAVTATVLSS